MDQTIKEMLDEGLVELMQKEGEPRFKFTEKGMKLMGLMKREHPEAFEAMARDMGWIHNIH